MPVSPGNVVPRRLPHAVPIVGYVAYRRPWEFREHLRYRAAGGASGLMTYMRQDSSNAAPLKPWRLNGLRTLLLVLAAACGNPAASATSIILRPLPAPHGTECDPQPDSIMEVPGSHAPTLCLLASAWPGRRESKSSSPAESWSDALPAAHAGKAWTGQVDAIDPDDTAFHWQVIDAPAGLALVDTSEAVIDDEGNHHVVATFAWTPDNKIPADNQVRLRVVDGHGNATTRVFQLAVEGGTHKPVLAMIASVNLPEGQPWSMPVYAADADGDVLTIHLSRLPTGARFDANANVLSWTPGYDQAGTYKNVTVSVSDGLNKVQRRFDIVVAPTQPAGVLPEQPLQTLRVGQAFTMPLRGHLPRPLTLADGETVELTHFVPMPPSHMAVDKAGTLTWTPEPSQVGHQSIDVGLEVTYRAPDGTHVDRVTNRTLFFDVLSAGSAPLNGPAPPDASLAELRTITPLPTANTHTDLAFCLPLAALVEDLNGDPVSWRVVDARHGSGKLGGDRQSVVFTPQRGYSGPAALTVVAEAGGASSAPITLPITISDAALTAIHLAPMKDVRIGQSASVVATVDFGDQQNVHVSADPAYLRIGLADVKGLDAGRKPVVRVDDALDRLHFSAVGPALLAASRVGMDGHLLRALRAINVRPAPIDDAGDLDAAAFEEDASPVAVPQVSPGIAVPLDGHRQLYVRLADADAVSDGVMRPAPVNESDRPGHLYYLTSDARVATVDSTGLITPHAEGMATVFVLYLLDNPWLDADAAPERTLAQSDVSVLVESVQATDEDSSTPASYQARAFAKRGGVIGDTAGDVVMIAPGALATDAEVTVGRIDPGQGGSVAGAPLPGAGALQIVAAFHLDFGDESLTIPAAFAISVQAGRVEPGDEVAVLRRSTVLVPGPTGGDSDPLRSNVPSWWLVGTAHLGNDGKLHQDQHPPFSGLTDSGDYVLGRVMPAAVHAEANIKIGLGDWVTFDGLHITLSTDNGRTYSGSLMAALLNGATGLSLGGYHYGVARFQHVPAPKLPLVNGATIDVNTLMAPFQHP
jgi:hypothetical protein